MAIGMKAYIAVKIPEKDRGEEWFMPDWFDGPVEETISHDEETCKQRAETSGLKEGEYFVHHGTLILKGRMTDR